MKITSKSIIQQIIDIESVIENMMHKIEFQQKEINLLKVENKSLKENYTKTLQEIQEYIKQLEQIKNHYVNSYHNAK